MSDGNKSDSSTSESEVSACSSTFDPLKALYSKKIQIPDESAPLYENINQYESARKGTKIIPVGYKKLVQKKEDEKIQAKLEKQKELEEINRQRFSKFQVPAAEPRPKRVVKNVLTRIDGIGGPLAALQDCVESTLRVKISDNDKLPKQFCYDCFIKIESSYTFVKEAQKVNITLRNIVSRDETSVIVETDSLLKSLTPTAFTPKSVLSLPDYEINSNFQDESLFIEQDLRQNINNQEIACDPNEPHNTEGTNFQNVFSQFTIYQESDVTKNGGKTEETINETPTKTFAEKRVAKTVNKKENSDDKNHSCPICGKGFMFKAWLDRHLAKTHTGPKYTCNECNKSFSKPHQLTDHSKTHSAERALACGVCDARFNSRKQLTAHARRHSDARPFACNECGRSFKSKAHLKSHLQLHGSEKCFLCPVCGWSFAQAGNLNVHMRIHTGAKPYKCSECNFKCSVASSLRRHEARHREAPAHHCAHCPKTFYDASGLARHTRTHTGALPYRCALCGRCFIDSWKRKTHLMRRHQVALHDIPRMNRNGDRL